MVTFTVLHRYGNSSDAEVVPDELLTELLAELDGAEDDVEHGDVWLLDSPWGIGVFAGDRGLVVLENSDPGGEAFHRTGISRQEAFTLLRRLADGELTAIRAEAWSPGYGS